MRCGKRCAGREEVRVTIRKKREREMMLWNEADSLVWNHPGSKRREKTVGEKLESVR